MPNDFIGREELLQDIQDTIDNSGCVNHESEIIDCVRYAPPAADVVEVVRCRDCKHWHYNPKTREWEYDEIKEAETHE